MLTLIIKKARQIQRLYGPYTYYLNEKLCYMF